MSVCYQTRLACAPKTNPYDIKKGQEISTTVVHNWILTQERIRLLPKFKGESKLNYVSKLSSSVDLHSFVVSIRANLY